MAEYDENLEENVFLKCLKKDYLNIIRRASLEGWIVCVPRSEKVNQSAFSQTDILKHILVPCSKENFYKTLTDQPVCCENNALVYTDKETKEHRHTRLSILFTEIVYEEFGKYKVFCIEDVLFSSNCSFNVISINSFQDCVNLLKNNDGIAIEKLHGLASEFHLLFESMDHAVEACNNLFKKGSCVVKAIPFFKKQVHGDSYVEQLIDVAVVSYLQSLLYRKVFNFLCNASADADSLLNFNICNSIDLVPSDLQLSYDADVMVKSVKAMSGISNSDSVIGKLQILDETLLLLNSLCGEISSDHLIPFMVYMVIKTGISDWNAQLMYLKYFSSNFFGSLYGKREFFIATLGAAVEFINSGQLFCMAQVGEKSSIEDHGYFVRSEIETMWTFNKHEHEDVFNLSKFGKSEDLEKILLAEQSSKLELLELGKCHPLCNCQSCLSAKNSTGTKSILNLRDDHQRTLLHIGCAFGCPKIVKVLLQYKMDMDAKDEWHNTALHYASQRGHKNSLLLLLHGGASVSVKNSFGNTPLHMAAMRGHAGCIKAILYYSELEDNDIDCNVQNCLGDTPLHIAARFGFRECVTALLDALLEQCCDFLIVNNAGKRATECCHNSHLMEIILEIHGKILRTLESLLKKSQTRNKIESKSDDIDDEKVSELTETVDDISSGNPCNRQSEPFIFCPPTLNTFQRKALESLLIAVSENDDNVIRSLLKMPGDFQQDVELCHPLCQCSNCSTFTNSSIANQIDETVLNGTGGEGLTALHVASAKGFLDIVKMLLACGSQTETVSWPKLQTALHLAAKEGHTDILSVLLSHGANPHAKDSDGNSALHLASVAGDMEACVFLVQKGSDPKDVNTLGKSSIDLAREKGYNNVAQKLVNLNPTAL